MGFPYGSHLHRWIFADASKLDQFIAANHERSISQLLAEKQAKHLQNGVVMENPPPCPLTPEVQAMWAAYVVKQGIKICEKKNLDYRIQNTALTFFSRFYLKESMARYPPEITLLTCIVAAIKAENLGEPIKLSHIFHDARQVNIADILKLEALILDVLDFHLLVLHVQTPLTALTNEFYRYRARSRHLDMPKEFINADPARQTMQPDALLHAFCTALQTEGEKLSLDLYGSQLPFLRAPSELAVGLFLYLTTVRYPLKDALTFLTEEFFSKVRNEALSDSKSFHDRAIFLSSEIASFCQQDLCFEDRWQANNMLGAIKDVRKWISGSDKGVWTKRKKGESSSAPDPKRPKTE